jgi:serine/threonine-protein kinase
MHPERWKRLQELFHEARELEDDAREGLLESHAATDRELVAQVRSMLEGERQAGILDVRDEPAPARIGAYRLTSELGRGGMGVVYLAERADGQFDQRVAIKLIHQGDADGPLVQRFLAERQILAGLIHPNIARLLDGGVTDDGRPYFVMEHIDGLAITSYCDRHGLDVRARLRLFVDVCSAVHHAHQNLIIHRDLKPSNILVTADGRAHLLDFGIAKLADPTLGVGVSETRVDLRVMTPAFASPEQIRGEPLTTASDIYSLGVLLYELLCGATPYQLATGSFIELATAVCEQEPERPSARIGGRAERLSRQLAGDLDAIVLMALRKEPTRRYASADVLRQDIERYLAGRPVLAHRDSRRYRLGKALRRHWVEASLAAIAFAALTAGLTIALAQSRRATVERRRAEQALAQSEGVTDFLMELFRSGDGTGAPPPAQLTALELLQRGAQRADDLSNQPVVHARLLDVIGQMSLHLARYDDAHRWLEQAVSIRRATLGPQSLDLASSLLHLGRVHRVRREPERAAPLINEALAIRRRGLPPNDPAIAEALNELGGRAAGPSQERLLRQALAILRDTASPGAAVMRVNMLQGLSTNLRRQGRFNEAVESDREALREAERTFGPDHHETGYAMIHLADHVRDLEQDIGTAERLYRRGLDLVAKRHGDNSVRLIHGLHSLAALVAQRADSGTEAEQLYRRALAIRRSATGPEHPAMGEELSLLAGELARQGRLDEADSLARQAIDVSRRTLGEWHPVVTNQRLPVLAEILHQRGRQREAEATYRSAIDFNQSAPVFVAELRRDYGRLLLRQGQHERAEKELLESLSQLERFYESSEHPNVHESKRALMALYREWGKPELAERYRVPPGRYVPY